MIEHMKQVLVQLDDATAARLEKVAPGRSRTRSEFIRRAIARALDDDLERRTREAYERWPDEEPTFDPEEWATDAEAVRPPTPPKRKRTSAKRR